MTSSSLVPSNSDYDLGPLNVHIIFGALSIGGSLAYVLFGISCNQMVWYFRSYPQDPLAFKLFMGMIWAIDAANFVWTTASVYYVLILRGIGLDTRQFIWCGHWLYGTTLVFTELCCSLVELFFILRMWKFAEKRRLATLVFIPYIVSAGFILRYLYGMFEVPCFPESVVNRIWLILSYCFKILSDGIIAGTMTWLLYYRSRGVLQNRGTIKVIRALICWTVSTGLVLWISTLVYLLSYTFLGNTYVSISTYVTRGRIYVIAMLAVINDRRRCREVIQRPESISLRLTTQGLKKEDMPGNSSASHFWESMTSRTVSDWQ